ncbi:sulfatase-like hydrolase/transferase [Membranihabitans marinus]
MVDDLGYGDIGAYNSTIDFTPHMDALAKKGRLFTDFHSNGPMCSPTRAAFLTGMYQYRFGQRFEGALNASKKDEGFPVDEITFPSLLQKAGYRTALFGKWHLGVESPYLPNNYGFDEFRGLLSGDGDHHSQINRWGMEDWWHNDTLAMENGYSTELITRYSVDFIETYRDQPFFLFISHIAIHFPWQGPDDPMHRKPSHNYEMDKWGIIPDESNVRPHVEAMVQAVDESVGEVMKKLKALGLDEETLVILTSDNGGYYDYNQGSHSFENISDNGPLRGQKTEVFEGGHRVPFIAHWPKMINANTRSEATTMTMDLFPTFMKVANISSNKMVDGIDIGPALVSDKGLEDRMVFWKKGADYAVRDKEWKFVFSDNQSYLFNLSTDIGEKENLLSIYPEMVQKLEKAYGEWRSNIEASLK